MRDTEGTSLTRGLLQLVVASLIFLAAAVGPAVAQQVTGVPGSPSVNTTIDGKQIPPPPPKFGGVITPNMLLIMTDDQGYGVSGTFTTFPAAAARLTSRRRNGSRSSTTSSTWVGKNCETRSSPTRSDLA